MFWTSKKRNKSGAVTAAGDPDAAKEPIACLLSDTGCCRELNEDSAKIIHAGPNGHGKPGLLVVLADGMGGHQAGEVASRTAVETVGKEYLAYRGTPGKALEESFHKANQTILRIAKKNRAMADMGTTCTALAIVEQQAWAAHVGDSRLYLVRDREIYQLSEDHTQCMEMVRRGILTMEEAKRHEDRNVLMRAMGTRPKLEMMTWPESMVVKPRDVFVLCSDGLHDLVSDAEIRDMVWDADPSLACSKLVEVARSRGGYDNITLAVVAVPPREAPAPLRETAQYEVNT